MARRWISVCCILLLLALPLSGCQKAEYLLGTWEGRIDFVDKLNDLLPGADGIGEYMDIDDFVLTVRLTFREDGTYKVELDEDAAMAAFQRLRQGLNDDFIAYLEDRLRDQGLGISIDALLEAMGLSVEGLLEQYLSEDAVRGIVAAMNTEGNYTAKNGKLYISKSLDSPVDESQYETYVVSGNELRILASVGPELISGMYPLVFKKVA